MITVIKQDPRGQAKIQYQGEVVERLSNEVVIQANWTQQERDLGYARFEPGDRFIEYYYTDRWFNIFDIADVNGRRKGWYCNVAEPAMIFDDRIEQIDLILDVWVNTEGEALILDEDEFAADTMISDEQRAGARLGLQDLLHMVLEKRETFASLVR